MIKESIVLLMLIIGLINSEQAENVVVNDFDVKARKIIWT